MEPECRPKVVRLAAAVHETLESVNLRLRDRLEHAELDNITSADVRDGELTAFLNALTLLAVNMVQKGLAFMHSRGRNLWWPVELGVIPRRELLLLLILWVVTLMRNVVRVVTELVEDHALLTFPVDGLLCLRLQVFLQPVLELLLRISLDTWRLTINSNDLKLLIAGIGFSLMLLRKASESHRLEELGCSAAVPRAHHEELGLVH